MKSKVIKKHYLKITFVVESPLAVGSGRNEMTDKDIQKIIVDKNVVLGFSKPTIVKKEIA